MKQAEEQGFLNATLQYSIERDAGASKSTQGKTA